MSFFQKIYIKFIKCFIVPCEKASLLMTKHEFEKLTFKEALDMRLHLMKCKYCRWLLSEGALISDTLKCQKKQIECDQFTHTLSSEKIEEIKKNIAP